MERNLASLLLTHLVSALSTPLCTVTSLPSISRVVVVNNPHDWPAAQTYCRENHDDLVSIRNQQEADKLEVYGGWIGLHRESQGAWKWSSGDENADFLLLDSDAKGNSKLCVWKGGSDLEWVSDKCMSHHPILCVEKLILVQEEKTWEEALMHCRELPPRVGKTNRTYDLTSLPEGNTALLNTEKMRLNTTTNEVWVGLRFLAGAWLWMNGQAATNSHLPHCPAQQKHCGAVVHDEQGWKMMNCCEKRHFLCSMSV